MQEKPAAVADRGQIAAIPFIEWSAIIAGAAFAAAISFVLLTFIATIGFSAIPIGSSSVTTSGIMASLAAFLVLAQQIGAFLAGGYVAGRVRSRWSTSSSDEIEFRDGLHGGLVWAVGVVIGAVLLFLAAGGAARLGAEAFGRSAGAAASNAPIETILDTMLRPQASAASPSPTAQTDLRTPETRAEVTRILLAAVAPGHALSAQDRSYLAQIVSQRTGVNQQDAEQRVNAAISQATEAARTAKHAAIAAGLVTGLSLILSLAAAWWAGIVGGRHRDRSVPARFVWAAPRS
jgi:hypothetical protein